MNIKLKEVAIYHPNNIVKNDYYIDHFEKKGRDISNFLNVMGRKERYIIDNDHENTVTMGIEASKLVLAKAGLDGDAIDMIVFSSQVPERTFPTNAVHIHNAINGASHAIIMDSNANCAGMTVAVEQASRYMMSNPHVNKTLIVGSDYQSLVSNQEEEITYANYGDAAAAVILEKTEEATGFIDSLFEVDSDYRNFIVFPEMGLSRSIKEGENVGFIRWHPFDGSITLPAAYKLINRLLERNNLTSDDLNACCFSQFSLSNILKFQAELNIPNEKMIYIGDKFGYTGTSSPFIALHEGIKTGQIKRGDNVLFWTVGTGNLLIAMLFKY